MDPKEWKPGDIGPVRLTVGDWRDNQTRSSIYGEQSGYPVLGGAGRLLRVAAFLDSASCRQVASGRRARASSICRSSRNSRSRREKCGPGRSICAAGSTWRRKAGTRATTTCTFHARSPGTMSSCSRGRRPKRSTWPPRCSSAPFSALTFSQGEPDELSGAARRLRPAVRTGRSQHRNPGARPHARAQHQEAGVRPLALSPLRRHVRRRARAGRA